MAAYHSIMLIRILIAALFIASLPSARAEGLPDLGDAAQLALTPQMERRVGESIMRDIRQRDPDYDDDAEVTEYLNSLGGLLVSNSQDVRQDFEFFLEKDPTLNAFALPGGYIGVNSGTIVGAQSESELAAVLAHEIAHVTQRHMSRMVSNQGQISTAALAALISVATRMGIDLSQATLGQIGLGAAGSAIAKLCLAYGLKKVLVSDVSEAAVERARGFGAEPAPLSELVKQADVVIATTGRPGLIDPAWVREGQIIFALSNPDPEIDPDKALAAGARFASDGRTINNALAFPGIFRGVLDVRSRRITPSMMIAAAQAIAALGTADELVPSPLSPAVHEAVARAVAQKARALGLHDTARA